MCLYPKIIVNRKYVANKKNGGKVPPLPIGKDGKPDERVLQVPVGCGKCKPCRKKKANEWRARLLQEVKDRTNGVFVTLTFSDESILKLSEHKRVKDLDGYDRDKEICSVAVKYFRERWRKKFKKSPRFWLINELGHEGTENVHLHGFIWTDHPEEIDNKWSYGYVWKSTDHGGYVNERTVHYCVKYVTKMDLDHKEFIPKIHASNGIGKGFVNSQDYERSKYKETLYGQNLTVENYKLDNGRVIGLPIYFRNKLYTEEQREKLWLRKLDEGVTYVDGYRIDLKRKNGEQTYYDALKAARVWNKWHGFGDNEINWSRRFHERKLRNQRFKERKQRAFSRLKIEAPSERN